MKKILLLVVVILLGAILRFYKIDKVPVSLYWDEVAQGYNAYSITKTGRDEYGATYPILFRSFEDYKMPGYIYATSLVIPIFGLSEFSIRFTSAFLGTLTILCLYFLIQELFFLQKKKSKHVKNFQAMSTWGPILGSFLLAISPWHLQFSRAAFEANSALFFVVTAVMLFLKGLRDPKFLFLSAISFAISIYFYRSVHVFLPAALGGFFLIFRRELFSLRKRALILSFLTFFLIVAPILPLLFSDKGFMRARQVNVIDNLQHQVFENAKRTQNAGNNFIARMIYNRRIVYAQEIGKNYLANFSPQFLFFTGDENPRHSVSGMGLLYIWELPFLLIGLQFLFRYWKKAFIFLLFWFLVGPLPSAIAVPSPHALRSLNMLPVPQIVTAIGVISVFLFLKKKERIIFIVVMGIVITSFFTRYISTYYQVYANKSSSYWSDGYKQLVEYTSVHQAQYNKIVISGHYWKPYIYVLFFEKVNPLAYQKYGSERGFDKYVFGGTAWGVGEKELDKVDLRSMTAGDKSVLVALSPSEFEIQESHINKITEIKNHNNESVFIIGELR